MVEKQAPKRPAVLIFDNNLSVSLQVVQCLAAADTFDIHILSTDRDSPLRFSRWVKGFHSMERIEATSDPLPILEQIKRVLRKSRMDLLLPINVDMIDFLITHADEEFHSLVRLTEQPSPSAFQITCDKTLFHRFLEAHEFPHPKTVRFDPADPSCSLTRLALQKLRLPVITKRSWGGGGDGMCVWDSYKELLSYLEKNSTTENPLLAQEFITGHELATAIFCHEGKVLYQTIQRKIYPWDEYPGQTAFQPSKGLCFFDDPDVRDLTERVMGDLHWNGIAQIDFLVDEKTGGLHILEINPRYWGSVLASQRMGINFPEIACRRALGLPLPPINYHQGKYITPAGYLLALKERLLGRGGPESFSWRESTFQEIIQDPMPRIVQLFQRLKKR